VTAPSPPCPTSRIRPPRRLRCCAPFFPSQDFARLLPALVCSRPPSFATPLTRAFKKFWGVFSAQLAAGPAKLLDANEFTESGSLKRNKWNRFK